MLLSEIPTEFNLSKILYPPLDWFFFVFKCPGITRIGFNMFSIIPHQWSTVTFQGSIVGFLAHVKIGSVFFLHENGWCRLPFLGVFPVFIGFTEISFK